MFQELARLGADFAGIDISNSHVSHSQAIRESQIPDKTAVSLLLPLQIRESSNGEGTIPYATASPNLHSLILDSSQYITLSDADQQSTMMRCYFYYQCNHFIDYFNDPIQNSTVIHGGDVLFQYDGQEGPYIELFGNPAGYIFPAVSRDHKFLLNPMLDIEKNVSWLPKENI